MKDNNTVFLLTQKISFHFSSWYQSQRFKSGIKTFFGIIIYPKTLPVTMAETNPNQIINGTNGTHVQIVSTDVKTKHNPRNYSTRLKIGRKIKLSKLHNLV